MSGFQIKPQAMPEVITASSSATTSTTQSEETKSSSEADLLHNTDVGIIRQEI